LSGYHFVESRHNLDIVHVMLFLEVDGTHQPEVTVTRNYLIYEAV
jgi:hypothetical protein